MIPKYYIYKYITYDPNKIYEVGEILPETYIYETGTTGSTFHKGYEDITTIKSWSETKKFDYVLRRNQMKLCSSGVGFATLNTEEKDIVLNNSAEEPMTLIVYIMTRDQVSQAVAYDEYLTIRSIDIRNAANCYGVRIDDSFFTKTIIKYLGMINGEVFLDAIRNFVSDLKDVALLGTEYGNNRDGILDYIESTGSYTDSGLLDYDIETGYTLEGFIEQLKKIIYYGG
jgi:hypothetical protein